jgi:hypothetical protein
MIEYEIILAVRSSRNVYVRAWMIYVHNVIYYVCLITSSFLLLRFVIVVISIVCFHIDVGTLLLRIIEFLVVFFCKVMIHRILGRLMLTSCRMDTEFITVDNKTFNLIRQHRQPFVFRAGCIHKLNVILTSNRCVNWSMCYLMLRFTWDSWSNYGISLYLSRRHSTDPLGLIHWMSNSFIVYQVTIVSKPMSMAWTQHFKLLVANIDPGILKNFFSS